MPHSVWLLLATQDPSKCSHHEKLELLSTHHAHSPQDKRRRPEEKCSVARLACVLVVVDCAVCQQVVELITHHLVVELDSVLGGPAATARIAPCDKHDECKDRAYAERDAQHAEGVFQRHQPENGSRQCVSRLKPWQSVRAQGKPLRRGMPPRTAPWS